MEELLSLVHGLLKTENYEILRSEKLAAKERWLYYAPCSINEGPLFIPRERVLPSQISLKANLESSRKSLLRKLEVWDYFELRSKDAINELVVSASRAVSRFLK